MAWLKKQYIGTAALKSSGAIGKVSIGAQSHDIAISRLVEAGYTEPFNLTVQFIPPIDKYIKRCNELGITIPPNASNADVHTLIIRHLSGDSENPPLGLVSYLSYKGYEFSPYIGNNSLWGMAFDCDNIIDKITFYVYAVYRFRTRSVFNLGSHPMTSKFIDIAKFLSLDSKFIKSMNNHRGSDLQAFGTSIDSGTSTCGSSDRTYAYTTAMRLLKAQFPELNTRISKPRKPHAANSAHRQQALPYSYVGSNITMAIIITAIALVIYIIYSIIKAL